MNKAVKNIFKIICYPLMYMVMQVAVTFIYMLIYGIVIGIKIGIDSAVSGKVPDPDDIHRFVTTSFDISLSLPVILSGGAAIFVIFMIFRNQWKKEKFWSFNKIREAPATIFLCAALGFALNIFTDGVIGLLPIPEQEMPFDILFNDNFIFLFLSIALVAPVLEEIIFRGIIQARLAQMLRKLPAAIILQALIFGVIHLNLIQGTYAFFLGIIIGLTYLWFDSIWFPVAVHVAYNGTSVILSEVAGGIEINDSVWIITTAAAFFLSAVLLLTLANRRTNTKAVYYNRWYY